MIEIFEVCLYCRSNIDVSSAGDKISNLNIQASKFHLEKRIFVACFELENCLYT